MPFPKIDDPNLKKPLCYDPVRDKFITYEEIISGEEKIVLVETLSRDDLKKLVIERQRVGPDYPPVQAMSGPLMSRDDVVRAIEQDEPFGLITIEAEKSYLHDLLNDIKNNLE